MCLPIAQTQPGNNARTVGFSVWFLCFTAFVLQVRAEDNFIPLPPNDAGGVDVAYPLDTGTIGVPQSAGEEPVLIFSETIVLGDGTPWTRLKFASVEIVTGPLGSSTAFSETLLQITGLEDGAEQVMSYNHLAQWQWTSAVFNGSRVNLELYGLAGLSYRLVIQTVEAGITDICDDLTCEDHSRAPSSHPAVARTHGGGCTGFIIYDGEKNSLVTAGHCVLGTGVPGVCGDFEDGIGIVMFNVPPSQNCGRRFPPPEDQYYADPQSFHCDTRNEDWAYFGVFPNPNTGLTPFQAYGAAFILAAPPVEPEILAISGYGRDEDPLLDSTQQTASGLVVAELPEHITTRINVQEGDSGGPLYHSLAGFDHAYGVFWGSLCDPDTNLATAASNRFDTAGFQYALANPKGVADNGYNPPAVAYLSTLHPDYQPGDDLEVLVTASSAMPLAPVFRFTRRNGALDQKLVGYTGEDSSLLVRETDRDCGLYEEHFKIGENGDLSPIVNYTYHCADVLTPRLGDSFHCNQVITTSFDFPGAGPNLDAELWQGDNPVYSFPFQLITSSGQGGLTLPQVNGGGYRIKLSDPLDPGRFAFSGSFHITCIPPDPPVNLQASQGALDQIELSWQHDDSNGYFKVYRSRDLGCCSDGACCDPPIASVTGLAYTDDSDALVPGRSYYYWVTRYDLYTDLESEPSSPAMGFMDSADPYITILEPLDIPMVVNNRVFYRWETNIPDPQVLISFCGGAGGNFFCTTIYTDNDGEYINNVGFCRGKGKRPLDFFWEIHSSQDPNIKDVSPIFQDYLCVTTIEFE